MQTGGLLLTHSLTHAVPHWAAFDSLFTRERMYWLKWNGDHILITSIITKIAFKDLIIFLVTIQFAGNWEMSAYNNSVNRVAFIFWMWIHLTWGRWARGIVNTQRFTFNKRRSINRLFKLKQYQCNSKILKLLPKLNHTMQTYGSGRGRGLPRKLLGP